MKNVCVVTSTRADYGLLYWPIKELIAKGIVVDLVVTGTHLSAMHGHTIDAIKNDGFKITSEIDIGLSGDRPEDICSSMALALNKFSKYFEENRPDLLLILGDRYEIFAVAQAALVHNVLIAHIHGGEVTEGAIDDSFRHSITKMSNLHFTSTPTYRNRVIQLGEEPQNVYCTGAPGLDNIKKLKLLSKVELENALEMKFNIKNILVTFHPVTISEKQSTEETINFFNSLSSLSEQYSFFITMPNADMFSSLIIKIIQEFEANHFGRVKTFKSLGQLKYLSLMNQVDLVAGNSSSGIIEAPFLSKAVLNVGDRQKGRDTSSHVVHVSSNLKDISEGLQLALSEDFQNRLLTFNTIYGQGDSGEKIAQIIKDKIISLPKKFHDIK